MTSLFEAAKLPPGNDSGQVAEWLKAHAWKACIRLKRIAGSNPALSVFHEITFMNPPPDSVSDNLKAMVDWSSGGKEMFVLDARSAKAEIRTQGEMDGIMAPVTAEAKPAA